MVASEKEWRETGFGLKGHDPELKEQFDKLVEVLKQMEKRMTEMIPAKVEASIFRHTGLTLAATRKMIEMSTSEIMSRMPDKEDEITELDEQILFGLSEQQEHIRFNRKSGFEILSLMGLLLRPTGVELQYEKDEQVQLKQMCSKVCRSKFPDAPVALDLQGTVVCRFLTSMESEFGGQVGYLAFRANQCLT